MASQIGTNETTHDEQEQGLDGQQRHADADRREEPAEHPEQPGGHLQRPERCVDHGALLAVMERGHLEGEQVNRGRDLDHAGGGVARHQLAERALDLAARRVADADDADDHRQDRDVRHGGAVTRAGAGQDVLEQAARHQQLRAEAGAGDELEPGGDQSSRRAARQTSATAPR